MRSLSKLQPFNWTRLVISPFDFAFPHALPKLRRWAIERILITFVRCTPDKKYVLNSNMTPWSLYTKHWHYFRSNIPSIDRNRKSAIIDHWKHANNLRTSRGRHETYWTPVQKTVVRKSTGDVISCQRRHKTSKVTRRMSMAGKSRWRVIKSNSGSG